MTYYNQPRANDAYEAFRLFCVFVTLIATLFAGAVAVLVILHFMEDISPAYCWAAMGVFGFNALVVLAVGMRAMD